MDIIVIIYISWRLISISWVLIYIQHSHDIHIRISGQTLQFWHIRHPIRILWIWLSFIANVYSKQQHAFSKARTIYIKYAISTERILVILLDARPIVLIARPCHYRLDGLGMRLQMPLLCYIYLATEFLNILFHCANKSHFITGIWTVILKVLPVPIYTYLKV